MGLKIRCVFCFTGLSGSKISFEYRMLAVKIYSIFSIGIGNDSIPPTPMDMHGDGDLSVPSPSGPGPSGHHNPGLNRRPRRDLDVDDMIDSTVDSSGFSSVNLNQQRSSYNDSNEGTYYYVQFPKMNMAPLSNL